MAKQNVNQHGLPCDERGYSLAYGEAWHPKISIVQIELACFRMHLDGNKKKDGTPRINSQDAQYHFWRLCKAFWPYKGKGKGFCRHPWAERMSDYAQQYKHLLISGPASCGKSDWAAVWALIYWMADPIHTTILVTSTDIEGARKRIWGRIEHYVRSMSIPFPQKTTRMPPNIRVAIDGAMENSAITLVPSSNKHAQEASSKLIGIKNKRIMLIGDEMTDISNAVSEALSNLESNQYFRFIGLANFASMYDPFGTLATPIDGYGSICVEDSGWETKKGYCLHIDGHEAYEINPDGELPVLSGVSLAAKKEDERSPSYWRFVRSFPAQGTSELTVFFEADMAKFKAQEKATWLSTPINVAGFDPSFSVNGDRCMVAFAKYGITNDGIWTIEFGEHIAIDVNLQDPEPVNYQRIKKFIKLCEERNVLLENIALDTSGGGIPFSEILAKEWGHGFLKISFGTSATEDIVSESDERTCKEVYADRATQMWFELRKFLEGGQVKGVSGLLAKELCARRLQWEGKKYKLEPKKDMVTSRMRDRSPDLADASVLALAVCRDRLGAIPGGGSRGKSSASSTPWRGVMKRYDLTTQYLTGR